MKAKTKALVIDDERSIRRLLRIVLNEHGYEVVEAESGESGLSQAAMQRPDVIILDLGLPDTDGHKVLRHLREWSKVPVLILSVRADAEEKVKGLDAGADDYVTKPFDASELIARLRAIQRRSPDSPDSPIFTNGHLVIDFEKREVRIDRHLVDLTPIEYALLRILAQHLGKVVTHRQLLREVWGPNAEEHSEYLRVHMAHLRKKLNDLADHRLIKTETGIGYRLLEEQ